MTDNEIRAIDEIAQKTLENIQNRKLDWYIQVKKNKAEKRNKDAEHLKTPLTVKELEEAFPSLFNMLTREHNYNLSAEKQKEIVTKNTAKSHKISVADYSKSVEDFYKDLGINLGKEYVVDGDKLGVFYADAVNLANLTLDDFYAVVDNRQNHGKSTDVPGNLVWRATLEEKQKQLNKGNNAGI